MPVFHEDGKFDAAELEEPEELELELLEAELGLEPEPELELEPELALDPDFEPELAPEPALALALEPELELELELELARSSLALFTGLRQSVKPARSSCSRRCITTNRLVGLGLALGRDAAGGSESNCSPSSTPLSALAEANALDAVYSSRHKAECGGLSNRDCVGAAPTKADRRSDSSLSVQRNQPNALHG